LKNGQKVVQETRGWDENKKATVSQRSKEEAHDYRYFPEPDLPPLKINEVEDFKNLEATIPELPWEKKNRLQKEYGIRDDLVATLANDRNYADFFEDIISEIAAEAEDEKISRRKIVDLTVNYLTSDLAGLMKEKYLNFEDLLITPENFADLMNLILEEKISSRVAKDVLRKMAETGAEPNAIVNEEGLEQVEDEGSIEETARKIMDENPKAVEDYRKGKESSVQFLVGMLIKETKGKANPRLARDILVKFLKT